MVDLIEQSRLAVDELIDVAGRATIEAVLELSACQVAGPRTPGRRREEVGWHGRQRGRVCLKERKLGVRKPRLRAQGGGEVAIPAYEAMQDARLGRRRLDVLLRGISTRQYRNVLPEMADTCGVSKSNVSREAIAAGEEALQELLERRFDDLELLVIYIDGMVFGDHHMISAVGVDAEERKHVLGIQPGATENAAAVEDLLQQLLARGSSRRSRCCSSSTAPRRCARLSTKSLVRSIRCSAVAITRFARWWSGCRRSRKKAEGGHAGGVSAGSERGHGAPAQAGLLVGPGATGGGEQFARRSGRMLHDQPLGRAALAAPLLGDDQSDRKPAVGRAPADAPRLPLAR